MSGGIDRTTSGEVGGLAERAPGRIILKGSFLIEKERGKVGRRKSE